MRRRHAQKQRAALGTFRIRPQRSSSKLPATFRPACQRATAASISAYALCRACPRDERRSLRRAVRLRSTRAEVTHCRGLKCRCDRNADWRRRAYRSAHRADLSRGRIVPVRPPPDPDLASGWSLDPRISPDNLGRLRRCDHLTGAKDRVRPLAWPNS